MSITPISKETLKGKRQLLKDSLQSETATIEKLNLQIETLKAQKQLHMDTKASLQADIDNLTADIGA
jgi:hypothetical protein